MSNARAIAAATATLRNLLLTQVPLIDTDLSDLEVTTLPLDLARKNITKAQLNLFLYETPIAAAWRNRDVPGMLRPGETGTTPLAITLRYLLTAYGRGEADTDSAGQRALGSAMGLLNDHPLLGAAEIAAALVNNDLGNQIERVRITWHALGVEEMSKLWTTFQTQYRTSVGYEVGVILIDSRRAVRAPLPVLKRGSEDRGAVASAGLAPVLDQLILPRSQSAIRLGEDLALIGSNLSAADSHVAISSARLDAAIVLAPTAGDTPDAVLLHIDDVADDPDAPSRWHPGYYLVVVTQTRPDAPAISSNALALALAPRIVVTPLAAAAGDVAITIRCTPRVRDGQRVRLLFGDRQVAPDSMINPADPHLPTELAFTVADVAGPADYVVRLRVDGVDSIPAIYAGTPPVPAFDPQQTVMIA